MTAHRRALSDRSTGMTTHGVDGSSGKSIVVFYVLSLYLVLDLVRPSFVWHFPKILSAFLFLAWILETKKVSSVQMWGFVAFVGILGVDVFIAENTYAAVWTTYGMFILLLGVCVPLITFVDTVSKLRRLMHVVLGIFFYIGLYAITHEGFGPAGAGGGQDENYVAAAMNLVIPLALFLFFAEPKKWKKIVYAAFIGVYLLAIVVGLSRGGFVGLLCGLGFSLLKSPHKGLAIAMAVLMTVLLGVVAGSSYWDEMSTITDTSESTADMRLELWAIAIREFLAYPITGVGGDNYLWRMHEFQTPEQSDKYGRIVVAHVHSTYFQLLAEMGLAGCIVFAIIMVRTYRDYREIDALSATALGENRENLSAEELGQIQCYARGLMGGMVGYMASIAFLSALYYSHLWVLVSIMTALHMATMGRLALPGPEVTERRYAGKT